MKPNLLLASVAGMALLVAAVGCSTTSPAEVSPTPNIEATVEARLAQERAIEATIDAGIKQGIAAQLRSTPEAAATTMPTSTPVATATSIPTATPVPIPTPTRAPRPTRVATATPTPSLINVEGRQVKQYGLPPLMAIDPSANYTATIRTNQGPITVDLFASQAPKTVNSFVFLAREGFYNGIIFHRVIQGFMIQGGDPTGTGTAGPGYQFEDEIDPSLGFEGPGILAMANRGAGTRTNGSQFFITVAPTPHLKGNHTIFGRVTSGQDVVTRISLVSTGQGDRPIDPVMIHSIEILKNGS